MIDALGTPQRILLLGGTSDLGLSIIEQLLPADRTVEVVLAGREPSAMLDAAERLGPAATLRSVVFDAADASTHRACIDAAWVDGDVDVVVFAFGVLGDQQQLLGDADAAAGLIDVNLTAAVRVGIHVAGRMTAQSHGHIVALSSIAGVRARPANFIYGASKAGFDAFFDGLGYELAGAGVSVSVVRPGFVRTRMTRHLDVPPLATDADTVARAVTGRIGRSGVAYPTLPQRVLATGLRLVPRAIVRRLP